MTANWPILSLVTFLPVAGAVFIAFVRGTPEVVARNARMTALWTSLIVFALSILLWLEFDTTTADFQFVEIHDWIPAFGITYQMGVDGISLWFVLLSTFLTPLCILPSWEAIQVRVPEYILTFLLLTPPLLRT